MMRFEAEIISDELLPAIRSIVASRLQKDYGLKQEEIAARLEVTQPAVSQYLNGTRASQEVMTKLKEDPQVDILLDDASSKAARDQDFLEEFSDIVRTVRDKGIMKEKFADTRKL